MFANRHSGRGAGFAGYSTEYTAVGTQTVPIPEGASSVTVEVIAGGGNGIDFGDGSSLGAGGGAYSKRNTYSVAGLSGIYISVPNTGGSAFARENSAGGALICLAAAPSGVTGGAAASGTGDVKYSGGNGVAAGAASGGGGAAGPSGNGGNASGGSGGAGGGSPAGNGGNAGLNGSIYGGGGGGSDGAAGAGAQGWIKLTWE